MKLNDFESHIDRKILARGYDYFENGYVLSIKKMDDNIYEAEVEGTEIIALSRASCLFQVCYCNIG